MPDQSPPPDQIEEALGRIAGSNVFLRTDNAGRLLKCIAGRSLNGKKTSAKDINNDLFGGRHSNISMEMRRLRGALNEYYGNEGLFDPIRIEVPERRYTIIARHYSNSPADEAYKAGMHHLLQQSPSALERAIFHFDNAIKSDPDHASAYAGKAEAWVAKAVHVYTEVPAGLLQQARDAAKTAVALNDKSWRAHAALASVELSQLRFAKARRSFERALAIDRHGPSQCYAYYGYLLATRQEKNP